MQQSRIKLAWRYLRSNPSIFTQKVNCCDGYNTGAVVGN